MLCEVCRKEEANVHYTQVINGEVTKMHLCESCAQENGLEGISFPEGIHLGFSSFALAEFLAELIDLGIMPQKEKVMCPNCGLSYHDFTHMGRLGCSECYRAFRVNLIPLLKQIHGKTKHIGRVPRKELLSLQRELQESIAGEEYV